MPTNGLRNVNRKQTMIMQNRENVRDPRTSPSALLAEGVFARLSSCGPIGDPRIARASRTNEPVAAKKFNRVVVRGDAPVTAASTIRRRQCAARQSERTTRAPTDPPSAATVVVCALAPLRAGQCVPT